MCTVTIHRARGSLLLTMNRDERRERAAEFPPNVIEQAGAERWVGPRDGAEGGTWAAVNESGTAACLLNDYGAAELITSTEASTRPSRGTIVPEVLRRGEWDVALTWIRETFAPYEYAPFRLLVASTRGVHLFHWGGRDGLSERALGEAWNMLTSSSWNEPEVRAQRIGLFEEWCDSGHRFQGDVPAFHLAGSPETSAWAPLMSREASCTRSITQIEIRAAQERARLRYWDHPVQTGESAPTAIEFPLRTAAASVGEGSA